MLMPRRTTWLLLLLLALPGCGDMEEDHRLWIDLRIDAPPELAARTTNLLWWVKQAGTDYGDWPGLFGGGSRPIPYPVYLSVDVDLPFARDVVIRGYDQNGGRTGSVCLEQVLPFRCPRRVWLPATLAAGPDCSIELKLGNGD
jgi:hypothetical protein